MRRFNRAVEHADILLGNFASTLELPALIKVLNSSGWSHGHEYTQAAVELRQAALAVGYHATVEATLSPATRGGESAAD